MSSAGSISIASLSSRASSRFGSFRASSSPSGEDEAAVANTPAPDSDETPETAPPATATADASTERGESPASADRGARAGGHTSGSTGSSGGGSSLTEARDTEANIEIPTPLTADQIDIMSEAEVKARLKVNSEARPTAKRAGDEETARLLQKEFGLLLSRLRDLSDD